MYQNMQANRPLNPRPNDQLIPPFPPPRPPKALPPHGSFPITLAALVTINIVVASTWEATIGVMPTCIHVAALAPHSPSPLSIASLLPVPFSNVRSPFVPTPSSPTIATGAIT